MGLFAQYAAKPQGGTGNAFKDAMAKNTPPPAPPAPKLGDGAFGEFSGNAVRSVGGSIVRAAGVVDAGLDQTVGRGVNLAQGKGNVPTNAAATASGLADKLEGGADNTLAGKAGTVFGTVAPYLTGVGEETGVAAGARVAAKTGSRVASYVASRVPAFAANTAIGTAQTGSIKQGAEAAAFNEVAAPVIKVLKGVIAPSAEKISATEAKRFESSIESTMPKRTPTVKAQGQRSNPSGVFGKIKAKPNAREVEIGTTAHNVPAYSKAKTFTERENLVRGEIKNRSEKVVKPFLEKNPVPFHAADYRNYMELNVKPSSRFSANPKAQAAYERVINQGIEIVDRSMKDVGTKLSSTNFDEVWNARKAFAQAAEKEGLDYTEGSDGKLGVDAAVEDFYKAHGSFIADSIGNPGQIEQINKATDFLQEYENRGNRITSVEQVQGLIKQFGIKTDDASIAKAAFFRSQMREIANLYDAAGNLGKKAGAEEGTTAFSRFEKAHPTITKVGLGGAALAADKLLKSTTGFGI